MVSDIFGSLRNLAHITVSFYFLDYGRVGLGVCFDCHKIMKEYGETDIWTLLYCIAWVSDKQESVDGWFREWLPETYLELYAHYNVIGANWSVDKEQDWAGYGSSTIYAPRGKPLITAQVIILNHGDFSLRPLLECKLIIVCVVCTPRSISKGD